MLFSRSASVGFDSSEPVVHVDRHLLSLELLT